jgi:hypothetical protein
MAQVTVRVKIDREITLYCEGENKDQVIDDIIDNDRLKDALDLNEYFEITEAQYDTPEPDEEEDEDEDN